MRTLFILFLSFGLLSGSMGQTAKDYFNRRVSKAKHGDYSGAIEDYTKALELDPRYAEAYNNRGIAKRELEDYLGAKADYTTALELDPRYAMAYFGRGLVRIMLGQKDSGCLDLSKSGEIGHEKAYNSIRELCN